jgi:UDP-N-acetyl-D-galactosamine dehydrogenase
MKMKMNSNLCIAVVGLGYVGLPLVVEFGKKFSVIGYDISEGVVNSCKSGIDPSNEISRQDMRLAKGATYTSDPSELGRADVIIVAVPTPVTASHAPDLSPLMRASEDIGRHMKDGVIVIYESTVYPGATEDECIPVLERFSNKKWKNNFHVGYSPERINPGDKNKTLKNVIKVVSGDTDETTNKIVEIYESIVEAGVYRAESIKIAEAAKVIENTQRDINIALMNELAIIFNKLDINTNDVLKAASTKWNFISFKPGLVGGHCIGVDPYYLTYKAELVGYHPTVILSGRKINDDMGKYIAEQTVKQLILNGVKIKGALVNILGLSFKENCSDIRNTKVMDIYRELTSYGLNVDISDSWVGKKRAFDEYGVNLKNVDELSPADGLVIAVIHDEYITIEDYSGMLKEGGVIIDVKSSCSMELHKEYRVWQL